MQQSIDTAEIDECTEVGDVLDDAFAHLILLELLHELFALSSTFAFQDHATRHDDVPAPLVQLDDLELELLAEQLVDVRNATQRDLRAGEERVDTHEVHHDAALDLLLKHAFDRLVVLVSDADALPDAHEIRLLLREDDGAFLVFQMLQQHFDLVAGLEVGHVLEFFEGYRSL